MEWILIACLTLLNGAFAMSEMALASSRRARLSALAEAGDKGASMALRLMDDPNRFLSTVQVGITSIGVINGIVGEGAFSAPLSDWLQHLGWQAGVASFTATALVVTAITVVTIVLGELVPKRIGQLYPETVARRMARPMAGLSRAAGPFVRLLSLSTQAVLRLMRIRAHAGAEVTEEEISASLAQGVSAGLIEVHEHQMVRNVFHLDERPLTSMMTPRSDIRWLEASLTPAQALQQINAMDRHEHHSWYPVCRGDLGHVQGLISLSTLIAFVEPDTTTLESHLESAQFVPETLNGLELLEQLRDRSSRLLLVVDEYGEVQGLLTPLDLLQAITGELKPETQAEAWAMAMPDGRWQLDGRMPVPEIKARLGLQDLPGEDRGRYNTLAGLLLYVLGEVPAKGQAIPVAGWSFEVLSLDGRRIDRVLAQSMNMKKSAN